MLGPSSQALIDCGANYQPLTREKHQFWRLLLPIFLHAGKGVTFIGSIEKGLIHIFGNLLIQWKTGFDLERVWGWKKLAILYMVSGIGGNIWSAAFMSKSARFHFKYSNK